MIILTRFLKNWAHAKAKERRSIDFCDSFYMAGLKRRGVKAFKLFA